MITESIVIGILVLVIIYQRLRIRALKEMLKIDQLKPPEELSEKIIIDCTAEVFIPKGYCLDQNQLGDRQYEFRPDKVFLYRPNKKMHDVFSLWEKTKGRPVLNANVLDYLLSHQEIIPEDWKKKRIFFFGTIYGGPNREYFVRAIYWNRTEPGWRWELCWYGHRLSPDDYLAERII